MLKNCTSPRFFVSSIYQRVAVVFNFHCGIRRDILVSLRVADGVCLRHASLSLHLSYCKSLDLRPLLRIDWRSCHSVIGEACSPHLSPCRSPIRLCVGHPASHPKPPFFSGDDTPPQGGHIGPVHLSSSGPITVEAFVAPEGPPISGSVSLTASNFPWEVHAYSHQALPWGATDGR